MADAPKAARLGDNHLCPQHLGKDIVANIAPTILIEGKPAARITSKMTCIGGPLDSVTIGEPTVLMMGLDAARMLDGTDHGGLVSEGAATVLVGTMSAMDKRLRLLARLALIDSARKKAADMPNGPEKQALEAAANRLAQNNAAVEDARLASDVYNNSGAPEGWSRVDPANMPPEMQGAVMNDPESGFYAAVYRSDIDGSYRLVYRGSESSQWKDWHDWQNNFLQGTGQDAKQYEQAVALAQKFNAAYGPDNASIAGHSLGGGLASAASLATGLPANTFNAAGLSDYTMEKYGLDPSQAGGLIDAYQTDGEVLTWVQEHSPLSPLAPDAVGTTHSTPAYDYNEQTKQLTPRSGMFGKPPPGWAMPLGGILTDAWLVAFLAEAVHRHNNFIGGIEKQKSDDITTIGNALGFCPAP